MFRVGFEWFPGALGKVFQTFDVPKASLNVDRFSDRNFIPYWAEEGGINVVCLPKPATLDFQKTVSEPE